LNYYNTQQPESDSLLRDDSDSKIDEDAVNENVISDEEANELYMKVSS
jgi:hypothetical protein